MVGGRFRDAMSDMAETIRRVFQAPPAREVDLGVPGASARGVELVGTRAQGPDFRLRAGTAGVPALGAAPPVAVGFRWTAAVRGEEGWARWAAGAQVCVLPLFQAGGTGRLEVPPLPRRPGVRGAAPEGFRTRSRPGLEPLGGARCQAAPCGLGAPRSFRALEHALALPVAFVGEDVQKLPKALWMRYTLKLVRETGENIRNLEVLGLYRIPGRGTRQINHQAATGRLLVTLGPESVGAPRAPFVLARKKDDESIVCCFVEDV
ncbi:hypothetical protein [Mesoterricola silvestris]|uniref:Uncharacterized protein n=1 Tax=Mesoterricola silvestris TaxID=2927979 RepID=A0AA48K6U2_9BACT|nr:hypothetical protein [Mesoterricola silvestris]BDU71164.1 hypothetical protein METEAL_03380 [Mesoterricola silvestris]